MVPPYATTARESILQAFTTLERRHGRTVFSPAEVISEARAHGDEHPDSTLRTFITSAMCINAPPNHEYRYDDLERVAFGQYRRVLPS